MLRKRNIDIQYLSIGSELQEVSERGSSTVEGVCMQMEVHQGEKIRWMLHNIRYTSLVWSKYLLLSVPDDLVHGFRSITVKRDVAICIIWMTEIDIYILSLTLLIGLCVGTFLSVSCRNNTNRRKNMGISQVYVEKNVHLKNMFNVWKQLCFFLAQG